MAGFLVAAVTLSDVCSSATSFGLQYVGNTWNNGLSTLTVTDSIDRRVRHHVHEVDGFGYGLEVHIGGEMGDHDSQPERNVTDDEQTGNYHHDARE